MMLLVSQINRDYENMKMLDVGGSPNIEEPDPEEEADDTQEGDDNTRSGKATRGMQQQIQSLRTELADAKEQIEWLTQLQEAIARQVLPSRQSRALFDSKSE